MATPRVTHFDDFKVVLDWLEEGSPGWDPQVLEPRERWRSLLLLLKAKLEAVRVGLSTAEKEFLADLVLDDGRSVYQAMGERIQLALASGKVPALPAAAT
jgi:hypothetical protein